jgi:hypothetical protein
MTLIERLIACIKDMGAGGNESTLTRAIHAIRNDPPFFAALFKNRLSHQSDITLEIYKRLMRGHDELMRQHPECEDEDTEKIIRQSCVEEATLIASAITSIREEVDGSEPTESRDPAIEERHGMKFDRSRKRVCVDGIWEDLTDDQYNFWKMIWEADGKWVPGSSIGERAPQIKYTFSNRLKKEIKGHNNLGYCLKRFRPSESYK